MILTEKRNIFAIIIGLLLLVIVFSSFLYSKSYYFSAMVFSLIMVTLITLYYVNGIINNVNHEVIKNSNEVVKISNEVTKNSNEVTKISNEVIKYEIQTEKIKVKVNEISKYLNDNLQTNILYENKFEQQVIQSFENITSKPEFREMFLNLVSGLEENDVAIIVQLLKRQQLVLSNRDKKIDIYTSEEQEHIRKLRENTKIRTLQVADNFFCYKNYFLPINHFEPSVFDDCHGIDKIRNIEATRKKAIVDVGAYIGDSLLVLANLTDDKIYSFEPVSLHYELMKKVVTLNNIKNAVLEKYALGDKKGVISINVADSCSSIHVPLAEEVKYHENVEVITLDSYIDEHKIDVGLIKVDIEGAEQMFLEGAKKVISRQKPILLISIYHNANDFFNIKPMIESWNLGYKFRIHKPKDTTVSREVLLICEI